MERKMMQTLLKWKEKDNKKGLVLVGSRQIGKTYIIEEFGKRYYKNYLKLDFGDATAGAREIFDGDLDPNTIIAKLGMRFSSFKTEAGESLLFLDEIQFCSAARSAIKPLVQDGRLDIIASRSLLGISGLKLRRTSEKWMLEEESDYELTLLEEERRMMNSNINLKELTENLLGKGRRHTLPVGYERTRVMNPMDFEEYLWAMGVGREHTDMIRKHIREKEPFDEGTLRILNEYFTRYVLTGGMPEAVLASMLSEGADKTMTDVQSQIVRQYIEDLDKYSPKAIRTETKRVYESIPRQLNRRNTRFRFVDVEGRENTGMREYADPICWLESAGMVIICDCLSEPVIPLESNVNRNFKLYMNDPGLLCSQLEPGTRIAIAENRDGVNKGGITENVIACMIVSCGLTPYYLERNKVTEDGVDRIEVDFIVNLGGDLAAIEVKSGRNRRSSSLKKLKTDERYSMYHIDRFIKLGITNIMVDELGIEHYPLFAAAFMDSMYEKRTITFDPLPELVL